jgi:hypothetical protein
MSDISALSNQYDQLVGTSEKVNDSVVVFKKQSLLQDAAARRNYPNLKISGEELAAANAVLLLFLADVFEKPDNATEGKEEFMPEAVKDDYKDKLKRNAAYLDEDLKRLHRRLQERQAVTDSDLKLMDMLVTALDTERNNLFRKLRTARG